MISRVRILVNRDLRVLPGWWDHALPVAGYLLLTLAVMVPALPHLTVAVPGGPVAAIDGWQNIWNIWWVHQALSSDLNPFHSPYLYYPEGVDLSLQTLNISNGLLVAPITALFGPVAGYNLAMLLALLLSGIGGYALALRITGHRLASFFGGLVLTFSPFHMTKVWDGQLELIALQWTAFYALFLLRAVEDLRWRDSFLAGLFLALIGYTSWYYLLFFVIYSLLFALLWLLTAPGWRERRAMLQRLLATAGSAALLLAPLLSMALRLYSFERHEGEDEALLILLHSADLLDFFMPSYLHPLWGQLSADIARPWHPWIAGWNVALGYIPLALAILGGVALRRTAWRWWVLSLSALVFSLGPVLQVAGTRTELALPYQLLLKIPGLAIARRPGHFVVITVVLLAPLAALGLRWLLEQLPGRLRPLVLAMALLLFAFEAAPPVWPVHEATVHPYYQTLAGTQGALLELPPRNESSLPLQAQMVHQRPILGGYVSRMPHYPIVSQAPGIRQLWNMRPEQPQVIMPQDMSLQSLNFYGVGEIVVHWHEILPEDRPELQAALMQVLQRTTADYSDEQLSAYHVPRVEPQPFAYLGDGWYEQEQEGTRHWRWMSRLGEIVLVNPLDEPQQVTLHLNLQSYLQPRMVSFRLNRRDLGSLEVLQTPDELNLRLLLTPGEHRLWIEAPVSGERGGNRDLSIVLQGAKIRPY